MRFTCNFFIYQLTCKPPATHNIYNYYTAFDHSLILIVYSILCPITKVIHKKARGKSFNNKNAIIINIFIVIVLK